MSPRSRENSTSASSFEVVARHCSDCVHDYNTSLVLSDAMKENLNRPIGDWLLHNVAKNSTNSSQKTGSSVTSSTSQNSLPANMKRKLIPEHEKLFCDYEFKSVISAITGQDNSSWITKEHQNLQTSLPSSCASETTVVNAPIPSLKVEFPRIFPECTEELATKMKKFAIDTTLTSLLFDESAYVSKLKSLFPPVSPAKPVEGWLEKPVGNKNDRPINEAADDVSTMQAVLGWKNILERIHASGEDNWLAPSARIV